MTPLFLAFLFVIGSCFGSFLCCQARRLRLRETNPKARRLGSRSICLHCKKPLHWYDNIPLISWLILGGKCRYCHRKIGLLELLSELGVALAFLALGTTIDIYSATPLEWAIFVATLILTLALAFLAIYDGKWGELPTPILTFSIFCAIIILALKEWATLSVSSFSPNLIYNPLISVLLFGGIYLFLYLVSRGKWVGDGDWLLGVVVGLTLANPWLTLIALFLSNFLACLVMFPIVKRTKNSKVYFGPFIIVALILVLTFADFFQSMIS